jgi:HEAT repeat protein
LAEVVQAILPLLEDDDGWLVGDAIKILAIWKSPDAVPALIRRTSDNRFTVRHEAIKALAKIKDPRGVEPIVVLIKEDGFQVEDALKEMGEMAEQALIERLTNPDSGVRRRVCNILKSIGGKETLKAMQSLPADPDFSVRVAAKDAMSTIILRVGPLSPAERKKAGSASTKKKS